jgi:glycosyltransferase involved in cell wall biosynthesis
MSDRAPLTVLHYTGSTNDRGGIMSVVRALAGAGKCDCVIGVSPGFVQRRAPPLATAMFPAIDDERLGAKTFWRARRVARRAKEWLAHDHRRIFHAHSRAGLAAALWLSRWRTPRVVVSVHCYGRQRWFYRYAARQLGNRLYWLSPAMKRYYGAAEDASWTQCMPGCVPLDRDASERRSEAPAVILRLGGVGMVVRWKGWHLIVDAIASLPSDVRMRVRFDHIGATPDAADARQYAAELQATTAQHGLSDIVTWRGEQPSSAALLAAIDCLVVASHNEPFSIALLEALAAGVPVLAADTGGAQDLIVTGTSGWFFRSGDSASLAAQIRMLAESGAAARLAVPESLVRPFSAEVVAERWLEVYSTL